MVAWSKGSPAIETNKLDGVPRPPGEDGVPYEDACVMRTIGAQLQVYKIPLDPTPLDTPHYFVDESTDYVVRGCVGMSKDGVPLYPYFDNVLRTAWDSCESDLCNAHAGKGEDYHYHGDPFGDTCAYGSADYTGTHPPQMGWGMDGYPVYGRHISNSEYNDGITVDLDDCQGHEHDAYGYHYHGTQVEIVDGSNEWTEWRIGPSVCWKGDITLIENFWETENDQVHYDRSMTANGGYWPMLDDDAE